MSLSLDANRVNRRRSLRIVVRRMEDSDPAVMSGCSAQERIAAVAELTRESWRLAGLTLPEYPRHLTPIRVVARSELAAATPPS